MVGWSGAGVVTVVVGLVLGLRVWVDEGRRDAGVAPRSVEAAAGVEEVALTQGLGIGRAVLNIETWAKIERARDAGDRFELLKLYRNAVRLQPRNAKVIGLIAGWLSELADSAPTAERGWRWMRAARDVLEEGVARNPESLLLARTLGFHWLRAMTRYPFRVLADEQARVARALEAGREGVDGSALAMEPAWLARAGVVVATYEGLSGPERAAVDRVVRRVRAEWLVGGLRAEMPAVAGLPAGSRELLQGAERMRMRLTLLAYAHGLSRRERASEAAPGIAQVATSRAGALLAEGGVAGDADEVARVWRRVLAVYDDAERLLDPGQERMYRNVWAGFARLWQRADAAGSASQTGQIEAGLLEKLRERFGGTRPPRRSDLPY